MRAVYGRLTGTPIDGEDTLAFSVVENIRPMIETVAIEQAANGYARMMEGKARFRMVLVTKAWPRSKKHGGIMDAAIKAHMELHDVDRETARYWVFPAAEAFQ